MTTGLSGAVERPCAWTTCHQPAAPASTANAQVRAIPVRTRLVPMVVVGAALTA